MDATAAAQTIPSGVYVAVGVLILANLGTVVTIFYGIGKVIWFISKLDSRVETLEKDTAKDINAAHKAIRDIRGQLDANS